MAIKYGVRAARVLRVFCPVEPSTLMSMLAGEPQAMERDANLAAMMSIIRSGNALGDFGIYNSVVEISPGWEFFTPGAGATPTLGKSGSPATFPTAVLTVYIANDAPSDLVDRAIEALLDAHPWEVPVIEMSEASLLVRETGT